jgi:UDP-2,3-diacylglucosamine pyrophosphatase LpxH
MTAPKPDIADILLHCEERGLAPDYIHVNHSKAGQFINSEGQETVVPISCEGREVFLVSDLHLAAGRGLDGRYDGCENFFFDGSFHRFLKSAEQKASPRPAVLIINGDFVDFLRVTYTPGSERGLSRWQRRLRRLRLRRRSNRIRKHTPQQRRDFEKQFQEWSQILDRVGIKRSVESLIHSVTDKEEIYGLKTDDYKSVLRLDVVLKGHDEFFQALAEWLISGHKLIIVKGNHDLEWYWLAVRNYLRLDLATRIAGSLASDPRVITETLQTTVLPNLTFIDDAMLIDGDFYIEHGHRFDPLTRVLGGDTVNDGRELNLPFGSFINRYLLNFVEKHYSFIDNIRPTENILPLMLKHRFFAGLRMLMSHLVVIVRTVPRRYISFIFGQRLILRVLIILLVTVVPPILLIGYQLGSMESLLLKIFQWFVWLGLAYGTIQLLAHAQLTEPDSLAAQARQKMREHPKYRLISFGHTHNPDQFEDRGRWFYNTGTWIPIVEATAANLRSDDTFAFLRLTRDSQGRLAPGVLERWDDGAARSAEMVLIRGAAS